MGASVCARVTALAPPADLPIPALSKALSQLLRSHSQNVDVAQVCLSALSIVCAKPEHVLTAVAAGAGTCRQGGGVIRVASGWSAWSGAGHLDRAPTPRLPRPVSVFLCAYVNMYVCVCVSVCVCEYVCMCVCVSLLHTTVDALCFVLRTHSSVKSVTDVALSILSRTALAAEAGPAAVVSSGALPLVLAALEQAVALAETVKAPPSAASEDAPAAEASEASEVLAPDVATWTSADVGVWSEPAPAVGCRLECWCCCGVVFPRVASTAAPDPDAAAPPSPPSPSPIQRWPTATLRPTLRRPCAVHLRPPPSPAVSRVPAK